MTGILEYFGESPEAVMALLLTAASGIIGFVTLLYNILKKHDEDMVVFHRDTRSLVSIDSALREKVKAVFIDKQETKEIHELRQIELEIANNHLRQKNQNCRLTISLESPRASIIGVTAANSGSRTPHLIGKEVTGEVVEVALQPSDPTFDSRNQDTCPTIVLNIPPLKKRHSDDRIFLRITYDGPKLEPEVQGARLVSSSINPVLLFPFFIFTGFAIVITTITLFRQIETPQTLLLEVLGPLMAILAILGVAASATVLTKPLNKWFRPIRQLIRPLPFAVETLAEFHFYDALAKPKPSADTEQSQATPQAKVPTPTTTKPAIEGELVIRKATFGAEDRQKNVTDIVQSKMSEGKLEILATIDIFGDPAPLTPKKLIVEYTYRGQRHTSETDENQTLSLP